MRDTEKTKACGVLSGRNAEAIYIWTLAEPPLTGLKRKAKKYSLGAAWLDTLTEAQGDLLTASRVVLAMGKSRELPGWLGAVHPGSATPRHAVLAFGLRLAFLG